MVEDYSQRPSADIFVPGGGDWRQALGRVTHLGIGAHPDDLEFMAFHGINECLHGPGIFGGVVVTDGRGSVPEKGVRVEGLAEERAAEQRAAARLGNYGIMLQLGLASPSLGGEARGGLVEELVDIFGQARPRVVYTHNPADRHRTHLAVCLAVVSALRALPAEERPELVYGCEVWGDLDWLPESDRVRLDCGKNEALAEKLNALFLSQIRGGKRYDLAVQGRRRAHATFDDPRTADAATMITLAMDLSPLLSQPELAVEEFVGSIIDRFRRGVSERLHQICP